MINSDSEAESVANCPKSIYKSCPSNTSAYGIYLYFINLESAKLGELCIITSKNDKISEGDKWKLSNIELENCRHNFPR